MVWRDCLFLLALFLCVALFSAVYYFLKSKRREKLLRVFGAVLAMISCAAFLFLAVFSRKSHDVGTELVPFWSYVASVKYYYALDVFMQILENIGIFVPIGFLLPFLFGKKSGAKTVILTAFFLSLFAEICQLVFSLGVCETDDLFNNTLGAVVGYGFYSSMASCEFKEKRLCVTDEKRFLKGFLPFFSVYEIMVLVLALREAVACLN